MDIENYPAQIKHLTPEEVASRWKELGWGTPPATTATPANWPLPARRPARERRGADYQTLGKIMNAVELCNVIQLVISIKTEHPDETDEVDTQLPDGRWVNIKVKITELREPSFDEWWEENEKQYSADARHMSERHMASLVWAAAKKDAATRALSGKMDL